ncbi:ABC transporter ATP-binding protein [Corynebacterium uterequi]|uniref:ABC-type multidrug transport system, ATPase and permease component n=1 Tax=Corynebacterium uterequi TaxID=1072256 RepID=A0A0G3HHC0_9CORY|nr:ABC transporter ATP-binding protein [Corynebacterium uterequi]AKK12150.1 ABC-type multidrug transport system, ATPase and permease component [Corynebacterium uterequi]
MNALFRTTVPAGIRAVSGDDPLLARTLWLALFIGVTEGLGLFLLVPAADALAAGRTSAGLVWALVALAVIGAVAQFCRAETSYAMALGFLDRIHERIGLKVATAPLGWFTAARAATLSRLVSSQLMQTGQIVAHGLAPLHAASASMLTLLVGCWLWDVRVGATLTGGLLLCWALTALGSRIARHAFQRTTPVEVELTGRLVEFATCQPELRSSGRSESFDELTTAQDRWLRTRRRCLWLESLGLMCSGAAAQTTVVALVLAAVSFAAAGVISVGSALGLIIAALRAMDVLSLIGSSAIAIESAKEDLDAVADVLTLDPLAEPEAPAQLSAPGSLRLDRVSFAYDDAPVLQDVSIDAHPGEMVALVGPSGCGKTTTAMLMSRFYDVDSGVVSVGGVDVRQHTTRQLMEQLSLVFQDVYLFDDTLEANIAVGNPAASTDEIRAAGKLAGVGEIVSRLPDGWETAVGEAGAKLSGGERQRVSIARALLKKSPIVLFDEATSSLDAANEEHIMAAVDQLRRTSTVVVIAHKLDTIANADRIYMFTADGRIDDAGSHAELIERCPRYQAFWRAREAAAGWSLV